MVNNNFGNHYNPDECNCGFNLEDNKHYLLLCPLYNVARYKMLATIGAKTGFHNIDAETMVFGLAENKECNKIIFEAVHTFIRESGRL